MNDAEGSAGGDPQRRIAGGDSPAEERLRLLDVWEAAAVGWRRGAESIRAHGLGVSEWLIEALALAPGQTVLELAAGPGDTGFMAVRRVQPGGRLICSDGTEAMLTVARERAAVAGVSESVEFLRLQLEWIDLPTASIDRALCRWGVMLVLDPEAALREVRRVLRPGGRFALAVWDEASENPWATLPGRVLVELGHADPPPPPGPGVPGMFALAARARLADLMAGAGFGDVIVDAVSVGRPYGSLEAYLETTLQLSPVFAGAWSKLTEDEQDRVRASLGELTGPYTDSDGAIALPGRSLVAAADA